MILIQIIIFFIAWALLNFILIIILKYIDKHFYKNSLNTGQQDTILGFCNVVFIPLAIFISMFFTT